MNQFWLKDCPFQGSSLVTDSTLQRAPVEDNRISVHKTKGDLDCSSLEEKSWIL